MDNPTAKIVEGSDGLLLEIDGQIVPNYDATMRPFEEGEVVTGHVVRIDHDEVLVDIGYKSEGVIPANELSIRKAVDPHDEVTIGEEVDALVLTKEDQDGRLIMSKKRARFEKAWRRIEAAAESGEPVEGTVIEVVKGGLIIDLGVRGFLPASLVDIRRVPNLDEYMGTQIECKVIELNRSRNNVVLSRRAVLEEERKEVRQQILDRLAPGLVVEGQISNIVDFGAFVDLDGIDGLIHISELSWSHVNHPSEVLEIGDTVQVKVLDIDRDRQRISLGLKQTQEDPWQRIVNTYNIGDELAGTVTKVVTFGAFVEILDGVEGLVHISELAAHHVENPREIVQPGDELRVKILEIDSERRRLSLSAKRVEGQVLPVRRIEPEQPSEAADAQSAADADAELAPGATADEAPQAQAAVQEAAEPAADEAGGAADALDAGEPAAEVAEEPVAAAEVTEEPAEVAEVTEEPAEVTEEPVVAAEVTEEPAEVTEEPVEVAEVTEEPVVAAEVTEEPVEVAEVTEEPVVAAEVAEEPAEVAEEPVTAAEPEAAIEAPAEDADTSSSTQAAESTEPQAVAQPEGDDDAAEQQASAAE
jgi:small subunit ribosomal protein S1